MDIRWCVIWFPGRVRPLAVRPPLRVLVLIASQQVSGQDLGVLLHDHRSLRLAVLNSCEGARGGRTDPYSGRAQSPVRQGIPAVVAMQFEITDTVAIAFARSLYEAVADGYPLDAAMAEARKAVRHQPNPVEWGTPVLYLRPRRANLRRAFRLGLTGPAPEQAARRDAPIAESAALTEPYDDPEYTAALGRLLHRALGRCRRPVDAGADPTPRLSTGR